MVRAGGQSGGQICSYSRRTERRDGQRTRTKINYGLLITTVPAGDDDRLGQEIRMRTVNGDKIWRPDIEFRVQKGRQRKHQHQHKHWNP